MLRVSFDLCDSSFAYFFSFSFHSWSTEIVDCRFLLSGVAAQMSRIRQGIDWNRKLILNLVSLMENYSIKM